MPHTWHNYNDFYEWDAIPIMHKHLISLHREEMYNMNWVHRPI